MTYQTALKHLKWSGNLPTATAIACAKTYRDSRVPGRPLRYSVAAQVIIEHLESL
jgi:hypothetical protein